MQREWHDTGWRKLESYRVNFDYPQNNVDNDSVPQGLEPLCLPAIELAHQALIPALKYPPASLHFKLVDPRDSAFRGSYTFAEHTAIAHLPLCTYSTFSGIRGLETRMFEVCVDKPEVLQELIECFPKRIRQRPFQRPAGDTTLFKSEYAWCIVAKDILAGQWERLFLLRPSKTELHFIAIRLARWLRKHISWEYGEVTQLAATIVHELHHGEFHQRLLADPELTHSIKQDSFEREWQLSAVVTVGDSFYEFLKCLGEIHPLAHFNLLANICRKGLTDSNLTDQEMADVAALSVYLGCSETIAYLLGQTLSLYSPSIFEGESTFRSHTRVTSYNALIYRLPPLPLIREWEVKLTCEISELGCKLAAIYEELFEGGGLAKLVYEAQEESAKLRNRT